jgi:hypothetical protein
MERQDTLGTVENDLVEVSNILMLTRLKRYLRALRRRGRIIHTDSDSPRKKTSVSQKGPYVITELYSESALKYIRASTGVTASTNSIPKKMDSMWDSKDEEEEEKLPEQKPKSKSKWWTTLQNALFDSSSDQPDEDFWTSPLFASGRTYLHNLPDHILSHSFLNSGYLPFVNSLLSKCGDSFTVSYDQVDSHMVRYFLSLSLC